MSCLKNAANNLGLIERYGIRSWKHISYQIESIRNCKFKLNKIYYICIQQQE